MRKNALRGFTLIELLIVIALIAVLAGAVIIALNPARQFQQARDSERWSHMSALANAIQQNMTENRGVWTCAVALPATAKNIADATTDATGVDICSCLVPSQVASLPFDPSTGSYTSCTTYDTKYTVLQDATTKRVTVAATPEVASSISVTY